MSRPIKPKARIAPSHAKRWLKLQLGSAHQTWIRRFRSYGAEELRAFWPSLGIKRSDTVLLHASFRPTNGFLGSPSDVLDSLLAHLDDGTLAMMSMSYTCSTREHLAEDPIFDVRRTPSKMGIISEVFRRRPHTLRSLSPTHPVIAQGNGAQTLLANHERCPYPCGPDSPLEKMLARDAKMLFFDLPFVGFTFVHYIEHQIRGQLPFPLYEANTTSARYIDHHGVEGQSDVFTFAPEAVKRRDVSIITNKMKEEKTAKWRRLGNTTFVVASVKDALRTGLDLARRESIPFSE